MTAVHRVLTASLLLAAAMSAGCRRTPAMSEAAPVPLPSPGCEIGNTSVRADRVESDGVIAFVIAGDRCPLSRATASQAVLDRLLFIGVPQSTQMLPMLDRPEQYREQPPKELRELREKGWSDFVIAADARSTDEYLVRVDVGGLRRWLERNRLARKFGLP